MKASARGSLCCLFALIAGCGGTSTEPPPQEVMESGVLQILVLHQNSDSISSGTGFLVNAEGYVVTNYHVIADDDPRDPVQGIVVDDAPSNAPPVDPDAGLQSIQAELRGEVEVIIADPEKDLAILKVTGLRPGRRTHVFAPTEDADLPKGMPLWSSGFPGASDAMAGRMLRTPTRKDGTVSQLYVLPTGQRVIQHNAAMAGGMSGGPTFDTCGRVIGVNVHALGGPDDPLKVARGYAHSLRADQAIAMLQAKSISFLQETGRCVAAGAAPLAPALIALIIAVALILAVVTGLLWRRVEMARSRGSSAPATQLIRAELSRYFRKRDGEGSSADHNEKSIGALRGQGALAHANLRIAEGQTAAIGRGEGVALLIGDARVSRRHAEISARNGRVTIRNVSTGELSINGQPIAQGAERELRSGDRVHLGARELELIFWNTADQSRW